MLHSTVHCKSEIGIIEIVGGIEIVSIRFIDEIKSEPFGGITYEVENCLTQIDEYFRGKRKFFALKLQLTGTSLQKKVWSQVSLIPYGKTEPYMKIAKSIKAESRMRAIENAVAMNPFAIVIPSHRLIKDNGTLDTYTWGLEKKESLLEHEKSNLKRSK